MINLDVKNIKITENYNKISIFLYVAVIHATNSQNLTSNIWNLKLGFFHEKKFARTCAKSNSMPFCSFYYQTILHQSFCLLEEAGVHEIYLRR